jgi:hypothetical protein
MAIAITEINGSVRYRYLEIGTRNILNRGYIPDIADSTKNF